MRSPIKAGILLVSLLAIAAFCTSARAQMFYLSPDTVTICSDTSEAFTVELRADENVSHLNLYSVFLNFDPTVLGLRYVNDTTWYQCNGWQVDSTCIDSVATAWDLDSTCLGYNCSQWVHVDSLCLDSAPTAWQVDSACLDWNVIWQVDSLCLDSEVVEWYVDSTCLDWECNEYDTYGDCIDSSCLAWEIDSLPVEYVCTSWQVDSTFIDSVCLLFQVDSIPLAYGCTQWEIDSICVDSFCGAWHVDSTPTAWDCTAYFVDSICYDSTETSPENADFFHVKTVDYAVNDSLSLFRLRPGAQSVQFFHRMTADSSKLIIESLIFQPLLEVDGPGLLATIKLRNIGSGIYNFTFDSLMAKDTLGNVLPVTGQGNVIIINPPPDSFGLISPALDQSIQASIGDSIDLVWQKSDVYCPGDSILYSLILSDEPTFSSLNTFAVNNLQDTSYRFDANSDLWYGDVYWMVRAANSSGAMTACTPEYSHFTLQLEATPPGAFDLQVPDDSGLYNTIARIAHDFAWSIPVSQIPDDTLMYEVHFWLGDPTPGGEEFIVGDLDSNGIDVTVDQFQLYNMYSWMVNCVNRIGMSTWSTQTFFLTYYMRGDANSDANINIGDVVYLINYIFKSGPPPAFEKLGDPNCDDHINIGDAVYLVNYIFKSGPDPCPDD